MLLLTGSFRTSEFERLLRIDRHGWGIWPKSAKQPVPFRPEEVKVHFPNQQLSHAAGRAAKPEAINNPHSGLRRKFE